MSNQIITTFGQKTQQLHETMSSSQLAEMLRIEKKEVNREIRKMFQDKIDGGKIPPSKDSRGYVTEYHLPELESKMFVAKKDIGYLEKITQFWIDKNRSHVPLRITDTFEAQMIGVKYLAEMLNYSESSKLQIVNAVFEANNVPTTALPEFTPEVRITASASDLLKQNDCGIGAVAFNKLLMASGIIEERTRTGKGGTPKYFKALTERGLKYGQNDASKHSPREVQPHYFSDSFMDLFKLVTK